VRRVTGATYNPPTKKRRPPFLRALTWVVAGFATAIFIPLPTIVFFRLTGGFALGRPSQDLVIFFCVFSFLPCFVVAGGIFWTFDPGPSLMPLGVEFFPLARCFGAPSFFWGNSSALWDILFHWRNAPFVFVICFTKWFSGFLRASLLGRDSSILRSHLLRTFRFFFLATS